jgi:hypothetical protein
MSTGKQDNTIPRLRQKGFNPWTNYEDHQSYQTPSAMVLLTQQVPSLTNITYSSALSNDLPEGTIFLATFSKLWLMESIEDASIQRMQ